MEVFGKMVMRMRTFLLGSWIGLGLIHAAPFTPATNLVELRQQLQASLQASASPQAFWGIQVNSRHGGTPWFSTNASALMVPASNTKLFTAALSLDRLGAEYRFTTTLRVDHKPDREGLLKGDLMVIGSGDPSFCARFHGGKTEASFDPLVNAVKMAGIRRIQGNLVCDESAFQGPPYGSGWGWDDLSASYGAATSALSSEDNSLQLIFKPGAQPGSDVTAEISPTTSEIKLNSSVTTGATNSKISLTVSRLPGESTIHVLGSIPAGATRVIEDASVPHPALWFGERFRAALSRQNIEVTGQIQVITSTDRQRFPLDERRWKEIARVPSVPTGDLVREMMKQSQNLYAQLLLLAVGMESERCPKDDEDSQGSTTTEKSGLRALPSLLKSLNIPPEEVVLEEGSGLSRKNLVTPRALTRLLEVMPDHRWGSVWMSSFPVGGQDGTLLNRFKKPLTQGNVRAKTGSLRYSGALSGYMTNAVGEPLVFAILVNHYLPGRPGSSARDEIDALVELLAQSQVKAP